MKKVVLFLITLIFSSLSYAQYEKGVIQEVKICATGDGNWARLLQFKVNGAWFGTYADYHAANYDNNITTSLVLMAYSQKAEVEVDFNSPWTELFGRCGVKQGKVFYFKSGDYISLSS